MRHITKTALAVAIICSLSATPLFASGWQKNDTGWRFGTDDANTTWYSNGWQWIDSNNDGIAECYYFDKDGYMLSNTTTPDGYIVNADGAWVSENGFVQRKNTSVSSSDIAWPILTSNQLDMIEYEEADGFCSKVASQFVFDNGGYNEWGISNVAIDMLTHSREENKKYGELFGAEEEKDQYRAETVIVYKNGLTVNYAHSVRSLRSECTTKVYLDTRNYPILKSKQDYIFKYAGDDVSEVRQNLAKLGFDNNRITVWGLITGQQFDFDGHTYNIIVGCDGSQVWGTNSKL